LSKLPGSKGQYLKRSVKWLTGHGLILVLAGLCFVIFFGWSVLRPGPLWHRSLPDFSKIEAGNERKAAFFAFLHPYIDESNADVRAARRRLEGIRRLQRGGPLERSHLHWLQETATGLGMELEGFSQPTEAQLNELDRRLDIIPPSLALAQAALESGWGTSRFAREGNNLFGMWCYEPGCGIVPKRRPAGATYELKTYRSPKESFDAYIRNLNTNTAYDSLRLLRQDARMAGETPEGLVLADGLFRYSQEQWAYVAKVKGLIRNNDLTIYDQ
jgi:Bax protein